MVDYISTKFILPDDRIPPPMWNGEPSVIEWQGLQFMPTDNHAYRATKQSLRQRGIGNLNAVLRNGMAGTLHLSNSLHKVAHDGANHTDFRFSELVGTVDGISEIFGLDFRQAALQGRIEFGVNFKSSNPGKFFSKDQIFKNRRPFQMQSKGKQYGAKFCLSSYEVKMYSPAKKAAIQGDTMAKISPEIVRFEIASNCWNLRQKGARVNHVKDILEIINLQKIGLILVDTAKQIKFQPMPPSNLEIQDLQIWHFFRNATPEQLKHCRTNQERTYYRHKRRFEKLLKLHRPNEHELSEKVAQKWNGLLTN